MKRGETWGMAEETEPFGPGGGLAEAGEGSTQGCAWQGLCVQGVLVTH